MLRISASDFFKNWLRTHPSISPCFINSTLLHRSRCSRSSTATPLLSGSVTDGNSTPGQDPSSDRGRYLHETHQDRPLRAPIGRPRLRSRLRGKKTPRHDWSLLNLSLNLNLWNGRALPEHRKIIRALSSPLFREHRTNMGALPIASSCAFCEQVGHRAVPSPAAGVFSILRQPRFLDNCSAYRLYLIPRRAPLT